MALDSWVDSFTSSPLYRKKQFAVAPTVAAPKMTVPTPQIFKPAITQTAPTVSPASTGAFGGSKPDQSFIDRMADAGRAYASRINNPAIIGAQQAATGMQFTPQAQTAAGAGTGGTVTAPASTGLNANPLRNDPLYQAASTAATGLMSGDTPAFDNQANVTRDAFKAAQAQAAKTKREMLMNSGLRNSGQYLTEGILGTANDELLQRGDLERKMNVDREAQRQQAIQTGLTGATNLLGQTSQENIAFAGLNLDEKRLAQDAMQFESKLDFDKWALTQNLNDNEKDRIWKAVEAEKARTWESGENATQRAWQSGENTADREFEKVGLNLQYLMGMVENLPVDQAEQIIRGIYRDATGKDLPAASTSSQAQSTAEAIVTSPSADKNWTMITGVDDPVYKSLRYRTDIPTVGSVGTNEVKGQGRANDIYQYPRLESARANNTLIKGSDGSVYAVIDSDVIDKTGTKHTVYTLQEVGTKKTVTIRAGGSASTTV